MWLSNDGLELTRAISALSLSFSLPAVLLAPFVGSIVDRYSRRNVMLIANICGIAIATLIALGMLRGHLQVGPGGVIEPATILVFLGFGLAFVAVSQFFAKSLIHSPGLDHGVRFP